MRARSSVPRRAVAVAVARVFFTPCTFLYGAALRRCGAAIPVALSASCRCRCCRCRQSQTRLERCDSNDSLFLVSAEWETRQDLATKAEKWGIKSGASRKNVQSFKVSCTLLAVPVSALFWPSGLLLYWLFWRVPLPVPRGCLHFR